MQSIREMLEALGVKVKAGGAKMECPACHEEKLTASDKKNIATCWACSKTFVPGKRPEQTVLSWSSKVMGIIAARCQKELPKRPNAVKYLTERRKLPNNVDWLTANGLGAVPEELPIEELKALAKRTLEEDLRNARAGATADTVKALKELEKEETKNIDQFFTTLKGTMNSADVVGAIAFIYTNADDLCVSIGIRAYHNELRGGSKRMFRIQPGNDRGLFNIKTYAGEEWEDIPPVVVEGEFNWLSLLAVNEEWKTGESHEWAMAGCACGGKNGADAIAVSKVFGELPLVIYDNDTLGDDGIPVGYDLVRGLNRATPLYAVATQGAKDLDELCVADGINKWRLTPESFRAHWEQSEYIPRPYADVGKELNIALGGKPTRQDYSAATNILWNDLQTRAKMYRVAGGGNFGLLLVRDKDGNKTKNRIVQLLKEHPSWASLMLAYGIGASDAACTKLMEEVAARVSYIEAPLTELYLLSHYDTISKCLYVDELTHTLKIKPDKTVEYIQNGDEEVFFTPAGDERKAVIGELGSLRVREGEFTSQILESIRWDEEQGLSADAAMQLYKTHIMSIFFDTLMYAKACPVFMGKAGGGKNSISNLTGMIFEGKKFNILPMPDKPELLDTLTADRLYVAFDEYDSSNRAVETAFKSWCTRSFSERRELYNTWKTSIRVLARGMAVSTNNNPVRDVASGQRQLMFHVLPRQNALSDEAYASLGGALYPEFLKHRGAIWSELIADLRAMVVSLAKADLTKVRTSFRMSDFGVFLIAVAEQEGWGGESRGMLTQMQETQMEELASKHTVVALMTEYLIQYPEKQGEFLTQGQWLEELRKLVGTDRQTLDKLTSSHMKKMLTGESSNIMKTSFIMSEGENKKLRQRTFAFWLKATKNLAGVVDAGLPGEIEYVN